MRYQVEMMRAMRHVRVDHLQVGWYQCFWSGPVGAAATGEAGGAVVAAAPEKSPLQSLSFTREMLDAQINYQTSILESIFLAFGLLTLLLLFYSLLIDRCFSISLVIALHLAHYT